MHTQVCRRRNAAFYACSILLLPTLVGCGLDPGNIAALLAGAGAGLAVGQPQPDGDGDVVDVLTGIDPTEAAPGQEMRLLGENLTSTGLGQPAAMGVDGVPFPLLTVGDSEVTALLPPLPAGDYTIALQFESGTSNALPFTVGAMPDDGVSSSQLAQRWTLNTAEVTESLRGVASNLQDLGTGVDDEYFESLQAVLQHLDELAADIATDIESLSPEDAQMLWATLGDSGLFEDASSSTSKKILTARILTGSLQDQLFALDSASMILGNASGIAKGVAVGSFLVGLIPGAQAAFAVTAIALKVSSFAGLAKGVIDAFPTDLAQVYYVAVDDSSAPSVSGGLTIGGPPSVSSDTLELTVGSETTPNLYGVFGSQGSLATLGLDVATFSFGFADQASDRMREAITGLGLGRQSRDAMLLATREAAAAVEDSAKLGAEEWFNLEQLGASWLKGVPVDMSKYAKKPHNLALEGVGDMFTGNVGSLIVGWGLKAVAKADIGPGTVIEPVRVGNTAFATVSAGGAVTGVDAGSTSLLATPVHFDTVETGNGVADFMLELLSITWINKQESPSSIPVAVVEVGPTCGDGVCEGDETCETCPADCGVCPPTLESSTLVSASGTFTTTGGDFEVAVSPQDSDGNFIGTDLSQGAFSFQDVMMVPQAGGSNVDVATTVMGIEVTEPSEGEAITAVLIFDSSGSMDDHDPGATGRRAAGQAFFDLLTGDDKVAVLDFGPGASGGLLYSRLLQDFTSDRGLLDAGLSQLTEDGDTPLYESIIDGLNLLDSRTGGGGVVIVLTDGKATGDTPLATAVAQANAQNVAIYPIGLGDNIDFSQLRELAQQTGGGFAEASDSSALSATFSGIGAGVTVGKVTVFGRGTYDTAAAGRYTVQGDLVTTSGDENIVTSFSFTADVIE